MATVEPQITGLDSTRRTVMADRLSGRYSCCCTLQTLLRTAVSTWSTTLVMWSSVAASWPSARRVASSERMCWE